MKIEIKQAKKEKEEAVEVTNGVYYATTVGSYRILIAAEDSSIVFVMNLAGNVIWRDKNDLKCYKNVRKVTKLTVEYEE